MAGQTGECLRSPNVQLHFLKGGLLKTQGLIALAALVLISGCGKKEVEVAQEKPAEQNQPAQTPPAIPKIPQVPGDTITTPSGLKYLEMTVGTGAMPKIGDTISAHYSGWFTSGELFDSSRLRGSALTRLLKTGQGGLIDGWVEGLASMKVGGRRLLIVPSNLGYGPRGYGTQIPPNATLVFDIELVGVQPSGGGQ